MMIEHDVNGSRVLAPGRQAWDEQHMHADRFEGANPQVIWQWFSEELAAWRRAEAGDAHADRLAQLALRLLHSRLRRSRSGYAVALEAAHLPRALCDKDWVWHPLYENEALRAGLMSIYDDQPVPLHDHPGADCLQLVVYGRVRLARYGVVERDEEGRVMLAREALHEVNSGDTVLLRREIGGVLGLISAAPHSVVLSIITPPYPELRRSWYRAAGDLGRLPEHLEARLLSP